MSPDPTRQRPDRNLALELVRVTEAAALAAARLVGMGDKEAADQAAVDGMRYVLDTVHMDGVVVIGEGEKDEAPMLYNGEQIGDGSPPQVDIAVDPLEGTTLAAQGMPERPRRDRALRARDDVRPRARASTWRSSPAARRSRTCSTSTGRWRRPCGWWPSARARTCATSWSSCSTARATRSDPRDPRGRRAHPADPDGDVSAALLAVSDDRPVDLLWGIGGTPEGVISAAAMKCIGGELLGRLWPRDDEERAGGDRRRLRPRARAHEATTSCAGEDCFFSATGVTDGDVLEGVRYRGPAGATTESLVMRSRSGTVRRIAARHDRAKLRELMGAQPAA